MEYLERVIGLTKYNSKLLLNINTAAAAAYILISPLIYSYRYASLDVMARIGENYAALIGIVLFVYLGNFENSYDMDGITYTRRIHHINIFILRIVLMTIMTSVLIGLIVMYGSVQGGSFNQIRILLGVLISALFLGMLGLMVSNISGNVAAGYMVPFGYYIFELFTKGKYTGEFYLMSLLKNSFNEKLNILVLVVLMLIINIIIEYRRS